MGNNKKDTKRKKNVHKRVQFVRDNVESRAFIPNKIDGELNPSDIGTKNLNAEKMNTHIAVMHTDVNP